MDRFYLVIIIDESLPSFGTSIGPIETICEGLHAKSVRNACIRYLEGDVTMRQRGRREVTLGLVAFSPQTKEDPPHQRCKLW